MARRSNPTPPLHPLPPPQGVFVDQSGNVLEGPNSNFALLTQEGVLVTPPFDSVLAGITIQRLMELVAEKVRRKQQ
jgi:branched-subunit amino acid aminotransferase/4-amino-4-deoxychorismate lyase